MYHHASTQIAFGSCKSLGKIILNEASIIMESFYPWKDLLPDKGVLSLLKPSGLLVDENKVVMPSIFPERHSNAVEAVLPLDSKVLCPYSLMSLPSVLDLSLYLFEPVQLLN